MALVQSAVPVPPPLSKHQHRKTPSVSTGNNSASSSFVQAGSTPSTSRTATPTGYQRQMSFQMTSFTSSNPYPVPPAGYHAANGSQTPQPPHIAGLDVSEIYTAVYSGIQVYEMMVNGVNCMRRREDSWLNATQILKVAGIEKGKRTKVLEKEILSGKHEKVQGGYGKYQGTWIEYDRGRAFCQQYGVEDVLQPLLEYNMGPDGETKGALDTPTKEQAMAAQRKKQMYQGVENRISAQSPNGTFFKNISASAASAVQAINKARFDSPSRPGSAQRPRSGLTRSNSSQKLSQGSFQHDSQQSMHSIQSEGSFGNANLDPSLGSAPNPYLSNKRPASALGGHESPRKRMRQMNQGTVAGLNGKEPSILDAATVNGSFHGVDDATFGVPPLPQPTSTSSQKKQTLLMSLMDEHADYENNLIFEQVIGQDLDIPMDDKAHTALIWASTLGRLSLVRKLVHNGANIRRINIGGETALMRAASAVNNFDNQTFPELLEVLGSTVDMRDGRGRTVLHHIAIASAIKGRNRACKYYMESLLEFVVRQGSGTTSASQSFANGDSTPKPPKTIGLARFMSEIVNAQDISGDTALSMAARNGNKALAQQLLEVGANPSIANNSGMKPTDFGVEALNGESSGADATQSQDASHNLGAMGPPAKKMSNKVADTGLEVINSMSSIIEDAKSSYLAESRAKQALIDAARTKLQQTREKLVAEQARVADLKKRRDARQDLQMQIANLRKANIDKQEEIWRVMQQHPKPAVKLGDADSGLWIDPNLLPPGKHSLANSDVYGEDAMVIDGTDEYEFDLATLTTEQRRYATSTLVPSYHLDARAAAYRANNEALSADVERLKQRSGAFEKKLRRVLSLSIGVPETQIENMLPGLMTAIESEHGEIDISRMREFLKKVMEEGDETEVEEEL